MKIVVLSSQNEILPRGNRNFRLGKETELDAVTAAVVRAGRKAAAAQLQDGSKLLRSYTVTWNGSKPTLKTGGGEPAKGPGVIATLIEVLQAGERRTVADLTDIVARRTGHPVKKVGSTVRTQLSRLAVNGILSVRSERVGRTCVYWA